MTERVAVYIDFDNVVISRYEHVHGKGAWQRDDARSHAMDDARLAEAKVDLGAVIDYATSFGVVAMTRAYADWSHRANASYRKDLVDRAVDLVQLFTASGTKNGADIRLAVDAVEDLSRHTDITHVVLVAGDSDYVPLAQRCKRMGRTFVGIGIEGATSRALVSACDEFASYEKLPGVKSVNASGGKASLPAKKTVAKAAAAKKSAPHKGPLAEQDVATELLLRAMAVAKPGEDGWVYAAGVKSQMQRLGPDFKEKTLGFSSFREFVESRHEHVESRMTESGQQLRVP